MSKFNQTATPAFSVTVSGNIGEYEQGQVLTTALSIADYFRTAHNETEDTLTLDDAQIMAIVKSIPYVETDGEVHGSSDWDMLVAEALFNANKKNDRAAPLPDTRPNVAISGSTVSTVADKFAKNAMFTANLKAAAYAPEEVKKAPLRLLLSVLDVYGFKVDNYGLVEHVEQSAIFSEMPHPESEPSEEYLKANSNKVKPQDIKKFAKYKVGDETKDFYRDFIYRQPEGKLIMDEVDELKKGMPGKNKTPAGRYANRADNWKKNQVNMWQLREASAIKFVKMAVACMYQWQAIVEGLGSKVGVRILMDEDGTGKSRVAEGFSTLQIYDKVAAEKGLPLATPLSISGFNNLDVQKAIDDGGTYTNLRDSTKRGTKEDKATAIAWTKEVWLDNVSMISELLQASTMAELIKAANEKDKATKKRTESANNLIVDMCNLSAELGSFARLFASDYQRLMVARQEEAQAAAEKVA